ncbi:MAG: hypothetical protein ACLFVL_04465 [Candidatus Aenigmatarchaeota archaeon]
MIDPLFQLIGLYFIYYVGVPSLITLTIWKIKQKHDFLKGFKTFSAENRDSSILKKNNKRVKILQVLLIIFILLSVPALHMTSNRLTDITMHRSRSYLSYETVFPAHVDFVAEKIGPNSDVEAVIEEMEKSTTDWHLDDIREEVDLEEITRFPGTLTVYQMRSTVSHFEKIVINYAYFSPIPVTRSLQFTVIQEKAFLEEDKTLVYPMPPTVLSPY